MAFPFPFVDQVGRLPIEHAASHDCKEEVEMLLPVTTPIPNAPDWSIEGVISHAKIKRPIVCYFLFSCCFHTEYCFRTKPLFFLRSNVSIQCNCKLCYYA